MLHKKLTKNSLATIAVLSAMTFSSSSYAALTYSQNFETMNADGSGDTLAGDGWLVGANVFDPNGGFLYNYFAYPAPQGSGAFSDVVDDQGGAAQGGRQLNAYSDYNNADHAAGNLIESNLFNDIGTITNDMVGQTYGFGFDAKSGNILDTSTTASAFIKVINTSNNVIASSILDTTAVGTAWSNLGTSLLIDAGMVGSLMQIGFNNTATLYEGSANFYDNINFGDVNAVPVPAAVWLFGSGLLGLVGVARRRKA